MDTNAAHHSLLKDFLGDLYGYLNRPEIQEVMVNSASDIWIEEAGRFQRLDLELPKQSVRAAIKMLARLENKDAMENTSTAIIDTRLGPLRVAAALAPTSVNGDSLSIRRHHPSIKSIQDYLVLPEEAETPLDGQAPDPAAGPEGLGDWLHWAVASRKNILVSGGTSSGKTTFMNALVALIPHDQRLVVIEDTTELQISVPNFVRFEANQQAGISLRDLVRLALRFSPHRILVGEVRGAEAFDLLQALNTGHDGGVASIHASTAPRALRRLETLVLTANVGWPLEAIRNEIASAVDFIVHMSRRGKHRVITEIEQINGYSDAGYQTTPLLRR